MNKTSTEQFNPSRREFIRACALGTAALASGSVLGFLGGTKARGASQTGPASLLLPLDQDWLFGGVFNNNDATGAGFDDSGFSKIVLPHCVTKLSWENWKVEDWEQVWIYRRHFSVSDEFKQRRVFLDFEGVMTSATPVVNGHALPEHQGGYLPFHYEITDLIKEKDNVLAVTIDSRWQSVPPDGSPKGPAAVDYLEAGGIPRPVSLRAVPQIFISDVFAKPVNVLKSSRRIEVACTIDAAVVPPKPVRVRVEMMDGDRRIAGVSKELHIEKTGETELKLTLSDLGKVKLWDVDAPQLYQIVTTLIVDDAPLHDHQTRIGLREARFDVNGFFLNGRRLQLFGLNRHEVYPYVGFAMPRRVMRHDVEMLRHEFNCNIVRCSHYPQSPAFLDACDELGLMVWEETPGWQFIGDEAWKKLSLRNVADMVRRDRNRPSVVIWGVRVNESRNDQSLHGPATAVAKALDDSRPTSGSMTPSTRKNWEQEWHEDVFAFDDYHSAPDGSVGILEPLPGVPYMLAEAVGQYSYGSKEFNNRYRRAGDLTMQVNQALFHAQAHNKAAAFPRMCGVIAWCAFDYASLVKPYNVVKCPGVADVFRIPKLGASFYQAQVNPKVRPVIKPDFYWDFGPKTPQGPGRNAAIFSNCDRLEVFVAGKQVAATGPDRKNFPHVKYPPFFADLEADGTSHPELRIDGYVGDKLVLSKSFSSDASQDQLILVADDMELTGDGSDATRLVFRVADQFGQDRAFADGEVTFELTGPGMIVGDNPISLADSGGVGAVWVKTAANSSGQITVSAQHSVLGKKSVQIQVQPDARRTVPA